MAVLLDTNVVSELLRPSPNPAVEGWVGDREAAELHFSAVGEAELRYGVAVLPAGRRRDALAAAIEAILEEDFENRVLPFDSGAAREYAEIGAGRRASGRPFAPADCQIAAIARSRGMAVATRNTRDFLGMGLVRVWFDGWKGRGPPPGRYADVDRSPEVAAPRIWLLSKDWRRIGLVDPAEVPGS